MFRWLNGDHERQIDFMNGVDGGAAWDAPDEGDEDSGENGQNNDKAKADGNNASTESNKSREGKWESGKGRCPVTGRRVLGGTDCLRRVLV